MNTKECKKDHSHIYILLLLEILLLVNYKINSLKFLQMKEIIIYLGLEDKIKILIQHQILEGFQLRLLKILK